MSTGEGGGLQQPRCADIFVDHEFGQFLVLTEFAGL